MPPRFDVVYPFQNTPREVSGQDTTTAGLKWYQAEYRMNRGYWREFHNFRAISDEAAKLKALEFLPPRKANDKTYMIVHKLVCLDDTEEQP